LGDGLSGSASGGEDEKRNGRGKETFGEAGEQQMVHGDNYGNYSNAHAMVSGRSGEDSCPKK
jgi:hypothetical protein